MAAQVTVSLRVPAAGNPADSASTSHNPLLPSAAVAACGRQDRDAGPDTVGHLDPDDLVPGRDGHRADVAGDCRAAMPDGVGHQFAGQQERQVYVRVGLAEDPRHEVTGRPHLLGHRRDRHSLAGLCADIKDTEPPRPASARTGWKFSRR